MYHILKEETGKLNAALVSNDFVSVYNKILGYFGHF